MQSVTLLDFLKAYGPLAMCAGGAFAIVRQAFNFVWRLATVERTVAGTSRSLDEHRSATTRALEELARPVRDLVVVVARIEERLAPGHAK